MPALDLKRSRLLLVCMTVALFLAACGGREGKPIVWYEGTPPPTMLGISSASLITPTQQTTEQPLISITNPATVDVLATSTAPADPGGEEGPLSNEARQRLQPNELGFIPVLMYHVITTEEPAVDDGYTRTVDDLRSDLETLLAQNYYVVPLHDIVTNRIAAPAGKHPVVLTFDDGTAGHFRYLIGDDGTLTIDPNSAIGVLEAFFAENPDFGRGGFFAVPPTTCFDWETTRAEPEQTKYCGQKLTWLLANGYEVGNHTVDHADLLDLDDDEFMEKVGGGWVGLQELAPEVAPNIIALPFGNYPDLEKHPEQRRMMREGFSFKGSDVVLIGGLMVGANPSFSPASSEWDPFFIARIRAYDGELGSTEWLGVMRDSPEIRFTSDGDPATIAVPQSTSGGLGDLAVDRLEGDYTIVVYDPETGAPV